MTTTTDRGELPAGTVAFLMTDIEGSTQLVSRLGAAWPA
jgi:class 3 adenylate cyclase